jgi:hypothetical protein
MSRSLSGLSLLLSVFGGLVWIAGCSSGTAPAPKLVPVAGKVVLDGTPLTGANVIFIPKDKTKGTGGSGVTNADGKYEARHQSNKVGIEPGTYMVLFSKIAMPDGSSIPAGKNAADVGAAEILPQPLSNPDPEFAPNIVTITETGGSFDFTLASK